MSFVLAGAILALVILFPVAALALRIREIYLRDGVWASLWARGPWTRRAVSIPADAPPGLRRFAAWFAPNDAETVAEARFTVSGDSERLGLGPPGAYIAVIVFQEGAVLRWRGAGMLPRTGFIRLDERGWARREWIFGFVPFGWRSAAMAEPPALDTWLLTIALAACWTPAALVEASGGVWQGRDEASFALQLPSQPGRPTIAVSLAGQGEPFGLSLEAGEGSERRALLVAVSNVSEFEGHRLPCSLACSDPDGAGAGLALDLRSIRFSGAWTDRTRR